MTTENGENYLSREKGIMSWLLTRDHKRIGVMYFIGIVVTLIAGGLIALAMQLELSSPGEGSLGIEKYGSAFTLHGIISVFLVIIPSIPAALGSFFLPIMLGAQRLAYPALNRLSFHLWLLGVVMMTISVNAGAIDTGWTFSIPYALSAGHLGANAMIYGVLAITAGTFLNTFNFLVTIHRIRLPDMQWSRMPLFVWSIYGTAWIHFITAPVLAVAFVLLLKERAAVAAGTESVSAVTGDPLLFSHLLKFALYAMLYVLIVPAMGVVSEIISVHGRKHIFGYRAIVISMMITAVCSLLAWGSSMFTAGQTPEINAALSALAFTMYIPIIVIIFNWLATLNKSSITFNTPMLCALAFIIHITIGCLAGLFLATPATGVYLHNTHFAVAQFHYIFVGGVLVALIGGMYHWWPKITGWMYNDSVGRLGLLATIVGFNLAFFPRFILGCLGMPARFWDYEVLAGAELALYKNLHLLSCGGSFILILGIIAAIGNLLLAHKQGRVATSNVWDGKSLEWQCESPPPADNFEESPAVTDFYDFQGAAEISAGIDAETAGTPHLPQDSEIPHIQEDQSEHSLAAKEHTQMTETTDTSANVGSGNLETFVYDDKISRKFLLATVVWGLVGLLVGVIAALLLVVPNLDLDLPFLTFGRLRHLHTNAAIFAFAGNAIFAAVYYSSQRLLKARMFSDLLSNIHFWGWQLIIVAAAITYPLGYTQAKEYAELEWPIDVAVVLVWVVFAINFFGTIAKRRERHLYVALWFYIATIIAIAVLYIFNNLSIPVTWLKSYPIYAGAQDAFMQWWYGHNAVAFFLTTPFLGLMYYFLPKAANRPVFSYRLSILHFWSLVFIYIWAGPHHLHFTAIPAWLSTLGMLFSLMLWMPSWGGMLNGLLTLRGAWNKVAEDPILKFYVLGITFYGMSTFEGPMLSIKSVNALSHYTDWTIAHVHAGTLGWVGFMSFGMAYWLMPRLFQTNLFSKKMMAAHFWIGTIGMLLYIIPIYAAGLTQGLMWRAFDHMGMLLYGDFVETLTRLEWFYWIRVGGGVLYFLGGLLCFFNLVMTWVGRPKTYDLQEQQAPALVKTYTPPAPAEPRNPHAGAMAQKFDVLAQLRWHRGWEGLPLKFTIWVTIAIVVASLFEIIPTFLIKTNVPTIAAVKPYTPLELAGRDIYLAEGCFNCHSQMIRPMRHETERYGEYSKPGEFVYDRPFQWGSRRIGPDLHRIGRTNTSVAWHVRHMNRPLDTSPGSIMPNYPWMLENELDFSAIPGKVKAMATLGVPYTDAEIEQAEELARQQAAELFQRLVGEDATYADSDLEDKEVIAMVAYLLRLGTDIGNEVPEEEATETVAATD